ncbi:SANT/Myb_domain [Hexamita inflata]|uniref:SANT/Myb domain n=1 Tax=Hexamita inflata TaxID=28002 RepID=A0AA86QGI8_9EUKA|nr:SANT/Myb domain [Hexamita inflata]
MNSEIIIQENKIKYIKWSKEDKALFVKLHKQFGVDFQRYTIYFKNRTETQIKSFYYNILHKNKYIYQQTAHVDRQIEIDELCKALSELKQYEFKEVSSFNSDLIK